MHATERRLLSHSPNDIVRLIPSAIVAAIRLPYAVYAVIGTKPNIEEEASSIVVFECQAAFLQNEVTPRR